MQEVRLRFHTFSTLIFLHLPSYLSTGAYGSLGEGAKEVSYIFHTIHFYFVRCNISLCFSSILLLYALVSNFKRRNAWIL